MKRTIRVKNTFRYLRQTYLQVGFLYPIIQQQHKIAVTFPIPSGGSSRKTFGYCLTFYHMLDLFLLLYLL